MSEIDNRNRRDELTSLKSSDDQEPSTEERSSTDLQTGPATQPTSIPATQPVRLVSKLPISKKWLIIGGGGLVVVIAVIIAFVFTMQAQESEKSALSDATTTFDLTMSSLRTVEAEISELSTNAKLILDSTKPEDVTDSMILMTLLNAVAETDQLSVFTIDIGDTSSSVVEQTLELQSRLDLVQVAKDNLLANVNAVNESIELRKQEIAKQKVEEEKKRKEEEERKRKEEKAKQQAAADLTSRWNNINNGDCSVIAGTYVHKYLDGRGKADNITIGSDCNVSGGLRVLDVVFEGAGIPSEFESDFYFCLYNGDPNYVGGSCYLIYFPNMVPPIEIGRNDTIRFVARPMGPGFPLSDWFSTNGVWYRQ
jgi:hypothetical protein